jgi:hypothetical protein
MSEVLKPQWGTEVIPLKLEKRGRWNTGDILPDNEVICGILGASGSGKTLILAQILPCIDPEHLKHVVICSRIAGNTTYDAIEAWCKNTKKEYYFASDLDEAYKVMEDMMSKKKDDESFLVVFDDFNQGSITTRENGFTKFSNDIITKMRNYRGNTIYIVQSTQGISTIARANLNMIIVFSMRDKFARQIAGKDFGTLVNCEKGEQLFQKLHSEIAKVKHSYFIGTSSNCWVYIYGKMDKIMEVEIN